MIRTSPSHPVIILGAGMVGLTLAQALKKAGIPFQVYERDSAADTEKGRGWALTVHWALSALEECLPPELYNRLENIQVDPTLDDSRRFCFLDLSTAIPKYIIPPSKRLRVNRRLLGNLLGEGIDIQYNKTLSSFHVSPEIPDAVTISFTDGTSTTGCLLVGTDGRNSKTRRILLGEEIGALNPLPVCSIGTTITMTPEQFAPIREIDPLLFQGSHPATGVPQINGSKDTLNPFYEGQLIQSWLYKSEKDAVPETDSERLALFKRNAQCFHWRLREAINTLPEDSKVIHIKLVDWVPVEWDNRDGRVTLAGDAAHAMTSYRGEAFNHGVADAAVLARNIITAWNDPAAIGRLGDAVSRYEVEMRERTWESVLLSTQACLDAHDLNGLQPDSPIVSKRAKVAREARDARAKAKLLEVVV
ncbi:monooxygenase, putative [Talaromyces stipitatus ATCC 10500]|uniref:Monooxygenase, putative n=1 Tax=Talaromyces stipitatus (strain ATCC 10500 / CBS 375.48 / QM 6759 / NRRL 1006) TaxID=441959 RepID=B8MT38_TALSN|nr:monooxygenase, putative [Talaromyces stipitatus ATCC 10500]EED12117.1 monooxygenase, putative [Talaromyces stipitatus ATCC 10500]